MTHPSSDWREQFAQAQEHTDEPRELFPATTLRDWFAGMALSNALWSTLPQSSYLAEARAFYAMADAMLEAREQGRNPTRPPSVPGTRRQDSDSSRDSSRVS